ncbi:hypothetical protein [Georgenia sp. SYP-B2076]|uniref:hypothetical protein n=1 Tax=Georgenia sp. SYP-B2076 TaxID=2495881 RepID=UPI000F8E1787|nr:hypothetical protein [Georgenia sp. SYP-B2076]
MLFYVILRFWFALGLRAYAFFQVWMPTNYPVRWASTDPWIKWGLPVGVALTPVYYLAMTWSGEYLDAAGSGWWWVPTLWGVINTIKFAHVAIRSPVVWVYRTVRRRTER